VGAGPLTGAPHSHKRLQDAPRASRSALNMAEFFPAVLILFHSTFFLFGIFSAYGFRIRSKKRRNKKATEVNYPAQMC